MTEERRGRKRPLRVPVGAAMYRRGDRLRDVAGVPWIVVAVEGEMVTVRTVHGALEREIEAERLREWERAW